MSRPHLRSMSRPGGAVKQGRPAASRIGLAGWIGALLAGCAPEELPGARTGAEGLTGVPEALSGPFRPGGLRPVMRPMSPPARVARRMSDPAVPDPAAPAGPAAPPVDDPETALDQLTAEVVDADLVGEGDRLEAALEAAAAERRPVAQYGPAALTQAELFGDGLHEGVCGLPLARYTAQHGGEDWEITLGMAVWENFVGAPEVSRLSLTDGCAEALLEAGGDAEAAMDSGGCVDLEIEMILPEGSACRACVAGSGGDVAGCQEAGECPLEAPEVVEVAGRYWNRAEVEMLACAPDYVVPAVVLGDFTPEGEMPASFDVEGWAYICAPFWSEESRAVEYVCQGGSASEPSADTMRVGVHGLVEGMRRAPDDPPSWSHRNFYTPRLRLADGSELRWAWEAYLSLGMMVEEPVFPDVNGDSQVDAGDEDFGYGYMGWGLNRCSKDDQR